MKFIEAIINKIISLVEEKTQNGTHFISINSSTTLNEIRTIGNKIQKENLVLLKRSVYCDKLLKSVCMLQTILFTLIVIVYNLFDRTQMPFTERNLYILNIYISVIGVNHFAASIALSLYSKTVRNLINSNPNVLSRIFTDGLNGYEDIYGDENPDDRDLLTMTKIRNICKDMDNETQQSVYILMKAVLVNKAFKNFIAVSIIAVALIFFLDIGILSVMIWKVFLLDRIYHTLPSIGILAYNFNCFY